MSSPNTSQSSKFENTNNERISFNSTVEKDMSTIRKAMVSSEQHSRKSSASSVKNSTVKKTVKTTVHYEEIIEGGDSVILERDSEADISSNYITQEDTGARNGKRFSSSDRVIMKPEKSLRPPTPVYKQKLRSDSSDKSNLRLSLTKSTQRVSILEKQIKEVIEVKDQKEKELEEKHYEYIANNKKMIVMKDEINSLTLNNKRLEKQYKVVYEKSKMQLEKYKARIELLTNGTQKIVGQLAGRIQNFQNFTIKNLLTGVSENSEYLKLGLKDFSLDKESWDKKEWKSYGKLIFPKKKYRIAEFLEMFESDKSTVIKQISNEKIEFEYKQLCMRYDILNKNKGSNLAENLEETFETLKNSIKKSYSQHSIQIPNSAHKPPRPPSTGIKRDISSRSIGIRKSNSRTSLASSNGGNSPTKSVIFSQFQAPGETNNILEALKEYCANNQNSNELPDKNFISQFITYLFQTKIFQNLEACLDLLNNEDDIEIMNELRKSGQLKLPTLNIPVALSNQGGSQSARHRGQRTSGISKYDNNLSPSPNKRRRNIDDEPETNNQEIIDKLIAIKEKCEHMMISNVGLADELESKQKELDLKTEEHKDLSDKHESLEGDLKRFDQKKIFFDNQVKDLSEKISVLESSIGNTQTEIDSLQSKINITKDAYYGLLKESSDQEFTKEQLDIKEQSMTSTITSLRKKCEDKDSQLNKRIKEIEQKEQELMNLKSDLAKVPEDLKSQIEIKSRKVNELELDIESRQMKINIFKAKIKETEVTIQQRESKVEDLKELEAQMADKKQEISDKYKNLAEKENQQMDLRASLDIHDKKIAMIQSFEDSRTNKQSESNSKFDAYNKSNDLEPVTEANESTSSIYIHRESQIDQNLTDTIHEINCKLDELVKSQIEHQGLQVTDANKMSLRSLGIHSQLNSIPNSTYGTAYKESQFAEYAENNNSIISGGHDMQRQMTEKTLVEKSKSGEKTERTVRVGSYDPALVEQQEQFQKNQISLIKGIASEISDFKSQIRSQVSHVVQISNRMTEIKDNISQSQINNNQDMEIQLDSEVISNRICDVIMPKIQQILNAASSNIQMNEENNSKRTFVVHSQTSPQTFYGSPTNGINSQMKGMAFNEKENNHMNVRSYGNLMDFKNLKSVTQYHDLMQLIFKISSMFTNVIAEIIQDVTYYEELRQEIMEYLRGNVERAHRFYSIKGKTEDINFIKIHKLAQEEYRHQEELCYKLSSISRYHKANLQ